MCVAVDLIGRLGNNLFQYALGRIIAEHLELQLDCRQIPWDVDPAMDELSLDIGSSATLANLAGMFPNVKLTIPGRRCTAPVERFALEPGSNWRGQTVDLMSVLQNRAPRHIRLRGWYQRYEYYEPHRDAIRQWFWMQPLPLPCRVTSRDVVVNIRRGADYGLLNWTIPLSYYRDILSSLPILGRVYVCGTGIDANVKAALAEFDPVYYQASPIEHFSFLKCFRHIVLSNSTFAWWAAFLSDAETIFAPRSECADLYGFTGFGDVDLHMREPRYREIAVRDFAPLDLLHRSETVSAAFDKDQSTLLIAGSENGPASIQVDDRNRRLLEWLLRQAGPIAIQEAIQYCDRSALGQTVRECLRSGFLRLTNRYRDTALPG